VCDLRTRFAVSSESFGQSTQFFLTIWGVRYRRSITLKAQGLEIRNAHVNIVNSVSKSCRLSVPKSENKAATYDCLGAFPLRLGVNVLSNLHLYYANAEKKLYFTEASTKTANADAEPTNSAATDH
jgi:hypothetical protein